MRKKLFTSTLLGALIVLVVIVAVATAGCGTATQASAQPQAGQPAPTDAQGILTQALSSTGNVGNATGDFNVSVSVNADAGTMPAEAQAFLGQPITLSGTYSFNNDAKAAEASLNASIAGQSIALGLKAVNDQAWIQFMGQWYQAPADATKEAAGSTDTTGQKPDATAIMEALTAAGVDPNTWLTSLRVVGEDTINGTPTYHLAASLNVNQIVSDAMKLMQSDALKGMMPGGAAEQGTSGQATTPSVTLPSQQELQAMQGQLSAMFQNLTVDMWIAKDSYQFRQLEVKATIVPPAETQQPEATAAPATPTTQSATQAMLEGIGQGIKSISLDATVSLTPSTTPVTVAPPTDAKPFSDLQQALSGLMGLFSGALGGATGTTGQ